MILLLDNFDSFTYNLVDYFYQLGVESLVMRNKTSLHKIKRHKFSGIVLSPGPGTPEKAGNLLEIIDHYHLKLPILGICLGHQAINNYFGGNLKKAIKPMHGKISTLEKTKNSIFWRVPDKINVVRYHSLVCDHIPKDLEVIGRSGEQEVMALAHITLPIWGLQFHPEAVLSSYGLQILRNWVKHNRIKN